MNIDKKTVKSLPNTSAKKISKKRMIKRRIKPSDERNEGGRVATTAKNGRDNTRADSSDTPYFPRVKLLLGIVSVRDAAKVAEICNRFGAALSYTFEGFGTARSAVLDYLGLGETEKHIVVSVIPENLETEILGGIQREMSLYLVGKGICFTLPLTGISSIVANALLKSVPKDKDRENSNGRNYKVEEKDRKYALIVAALQSGYADEAMSAAREAGAGGGTLINASTLDNRKAEQLIGVTLQQETQILLILAKKERKTAIMHAIRDAAGLKTDAGGVFFSLPVDHLVGVGSGAEFVESADTDNSDRSDR